MDKLTDLQLCGCIILKYALESGQNEALPELLRIITIEMDMNYDLILSVMRNIILPPLNRSKAGITENKSSFVFAGELDKHVWKILKKRGISLN